MTTDNSSSHKKTSYKGVIIFSIVALSMYGVWTKVRVDLCLDSARDSYYQNWAAACKTTAKAGREGYADCMNDPHVTARDCKRIWNQRDASARCALPMIIANQIDSRLNKDRSFCVSHG